MALIPNITLARATAAAEIANTSFAAQFLFPSVLVDSMPIAPDDGAKVARFRAYKRKGLDNLRQPNGLTTLAAKGQPAQQIPMTIESYEAEAQFRHLEKRIDLDEAESMKDYGFDDWAQSDVVTALVHGILNDREYSARTVATASGSYASGNTLAGSSAGYWDDLNVNPLAQLEQARNQLNRFGAFNGVGDGTVARMFFSADAFDAFRSNPFVRSSFAGDGPQLLTRTQLEERLQDILSPNRTMPVEVRIGDAAAQNTNQGRADNPDLVWSGTAVLFISQKDGASNGLKRRVWGRSYRPKFQGQAPNSMWAINQYRVDETEELAIRIKTAYGDSVFDTTSGFLFSGITTP
jgi:hypothetical protein